LRIYAIFIAIFVYVIVTEPLISMSGDGFLSGIP